MPKYVNEANGLIVDYPADVAALFPALKLVPSERAKDEDEVEIQVEAGNDPKPTGHAAKNDNKNGDLNAK